MYLHRSIETTLSKIAKEFTCVVIYGPRQVGKSTTLQFMYGDKAKYVTLDDVRDRNQAQLNPGLFLDTYGWPLIIDEIQKAPELLAEIKIRIDKQKLIWLKDTQKPQLMYILTGSNQFVLQQNVAESLAGRAAVLNMYSFTEGEKEGYPGIKFSPVIRDLLELEGKYGDVSQSRTAIFTKIFQGGMPEVITGNSEWEFYYRSYVSNYLDKDIKEVIRANSEGQFISFMEYVAARTAQIVNVDDISRNIGISVQTCKRWLTILQASGIITFLQPYMANISSRIIKSPKIYFMDTGLCAYLSKWLSADLLQRGAMAGAFYETYVVSGIIKSLANAGVDPKRYVYYYRDRSNKEIDVVFVTAEGIYPIEIKKGVKPERADKNFSVLAKFGLPVLPGIVIASTDRIRAINTDVYEVPVGLLK